MNETLTLAIIGHLVGDYLLQTDWMAKNKKQKILPCLVHCLVWTTSVCLFSGWSNPISILFIFECHFIQDHTQIVSWWMQLKWKSQVGFMQPPLSPWSLIVVDNVWHIVQLFIAWKITSL